MKHILLGFVALAAFGCSSHSPYDVAPEEVRQHMGKVGTGAPDAKHLAPGETRHEKLIKKGDTLPDGSIATHDGKIVTVEVTKGG